MARVGKAHGCGGLNSSPHACTTDALHWAIALAPCLLKTKQNKNPERSFQRTEVCIWGCLQSALMSETRSGLCELEWLSGLLWQVPVLFLPTAWISDCYLSWSWPLQSPGGGVHEAPPLPEDVWTISDALSHSPQWCCHREVALAQVNNLQPMLLQVPLVKCRGPQK